MTYPCACCSFLTRAEPSNGNYDICSVCFWEDDPIQNDQADADSGSNRITLHQARLNFKELGQVSKDL
ncbi:CPCC family cysteine-rich protein [Commensalibacter nepenthis]|uniref:CPCC family cysteine-rich protein n=1 Tax=Commensalibacter nepenthis TaxID=3043872 RepID=A0ABT6Q5G0_9PROT|nr:CPCC family cysteine-rich protein [Commensalibacter sp. TBRC 10068]MDI2112134.1 CPCC family cysteine-rich protein [Commensalibacter sp. TBRC 10068]